MPLWKRALAKVDSIMGGLFVIAAVSVAICSIWPEWRVSPTPIADSLFLLTLGLAGLGASRAIRGGVKWWWLLQIVAFVPIEAFFFLLAAGEVKM